MQGLLRGLLVDRFKLVMRVEQKTMPVYALTVAGGGPTLRTSSMAEKDCLLDTDPSDGCHDFVPGRGHPLVANAITMDDLARYLENWADLPVVNGRTWTACSLFGREAGGLCGCRLPPPGNAPAATFDDLPELSAVLRTLGLELKQQVATMPVYTVAHIERPASE